jgi:hypothetical protein
MQQAAAIIVNELPLHTQNAASKRCRPFPFEKVVFFLAIFNRTELRVAYGAVLSSYTRLLRMKITIGRQTDRQTDMHTVALSA